MKRLSRIFLTIAGVFHIVNGATFLIVSVALTVFSIVAFVGGGIGLFQYFQEQIGEGTGADIANGTVILIGVLYLFIATIFVGFGIVSFIASKVTFKARNIGEKANFVASIVFGAIFDVGFGIAGGILGIIAENKEKKEKPVEEAPVEEASEVVE